MSSSSGKEDSFRDLFRLSGLSQDNSLGQELSSVMDERIPPFIVVDEAPALVEILLLFKASACARFDGIRLLFRIVVVIEEKKIQELLCGNLVMKFDIGDLEISASREKLQYTDYTRKNIKKKLKTVSDELISVISKEFSGCKTLWDAKCLMGSIFDMASNLYNLRNFVAEKMKFKGKKIGDTSISNYYPRLERRFALMDVLYLSLQYALLRSLRCKRKPHQSSPWLTTPPIR